MLQKVQFAMSNGSSIQEIKEPLRSEKVKVLKMLKDLQEENYKRGYEEIVKTL
jgi:hypothetical protein